MARRQSRGENEEQKSLATSRDSIASELVNGPPNFQPTDPDTPWAQRINDKKQAILDGLRKMAAIMIKSCLTHKIIKDKDFQRLRNRRGDKAVEEILTFISHGDRQTYEVFREILKEKKQTALYELLDIENFKDKPEKVRKGSSMRDFMRDLRDDFHKQTQKMDDVMATVKRMEITQAEEIKRLRADCEKREKECNRLKETNAALKAKIEKLKQKLKLANGSGEEYKKVENELREKTQELEQNKEDKARLETETKQLKNKIRKIETERSSDALETVGATP